MKECQRLLECARDSDCDQSRLEIAEEKDKNKQLMKLQSKGLTLLGVLFFFFFWWWMVKFPSLADRDGGPLLGNIYIIYVHTTWIPLVAGLRHTVLAAAGPGSSPCPVASHTDTQTQTTSLVWPPDPTVSLAVENLWSDSVHTHTCQIKRPQPWK